MLNIAFVKTFVTLVETGSFSDAARKLDLAQPTVSQHMHKLEAKLGTKLIDRSSRACIPTAKGENLLPFARSLLQSAIRLEESVDSQYLCIGCSGNIAAYFISSELKRFVDQQPQAIRWDIHTATNPEIIDALHQGHVDVAAMEWADTSANLDVRPWREETLVVILPPDHPMAGAKTLSMDDFLSLDFIGGEPGSGTGKTLSDALGKAAARLRVTHNLHSTEAVKSAVRAGLGCSIVLEGAVFEEVKAGHLAAARLEGITLNKTFYLATQPGLPAGSAARRLIDLLAPPTS